MYIVQLNDFSCPCELIDYNINISRGYNKYELINLNIILVVNDVHSKF